MKKFVATILILVMAFGLALPALADSSDVYDLCIKEYSAHLTSNHYKCIRVDGLINGRPTTSVKYVTIPADAGLVSLILERAGMLDRAKTRAELKTLTVASPVVDGAVLFKYSSTGALALVGIYANGHQFYIKSGYVVMEAYSANYWNRVGVIAG